METNKKIGAYVGIDPGKNGAAALWAETTEVRVYDYKTLKGAAKVIKEWSLEFDIKLAALEKVNSFPHDGRERVFKFGTNFGQWRAILTIFGIEFIEPWSFQWKKSIPRISAEDNKRLAMAWCIHEFPGAENFINKLKHHDRAEALLLAKYAKEHDERKPKGVQNRKAVQS